MPPTNTTAGTAINITTLPYNFTDDVSGLAAPYTLWWKRTATVDDVMLGFVAFAQAGATYRPQITFWSGPDASTLTQIDSTNYTIGHDVPCQFPVTVGTTYWFKVENDAFGTTGGILVFDVQPSPNEVVPAGSIFINDDTESLDIAGIFAGIWATILNQNTGAVISQKRTTVGEEGAIATDGTMMLQNDDALSEPSRLYVYNPNFSQIATIVLSVGSITVSMNSRTDIFYVTERISPSANSTLKTYSKAGVLLNTYTITGYTPFTCAVKKDATIVYVNNGNVAANIKKFTLASSVLADFAVGEAGKSLKKQGMAVLNDDTLLAAWYDGASTVVVKRYDTTGAIINSYSYTTPTSMSDGPRIAIIETDSTFFWVWASGVSGGKRISKFTKFNVATGAILTDFTKFVFESGSGPAESGNVMPAQRFGNSKSCPFLILPSGVGADSGIFVIVPGKRDDSNGILGVAIPAPTFKTALLP